MKKSKIPFESMDQKVQTNISTSRSHQSKKRRKILSGAWKRFVINSPTSKPKPDIPTFWQCVVHLKLMRAFARLRQDVLDSSSLSNGRSSPGDGSSHEDEDEDEHAWNHYVLQASHRFQDWWISIMPKRDSKSLQGRDQSITRQPEKLLALLQDEKDFDWIEEGLPPLDILLILHSFMLNPHCFLKDCARYDMLSLWLAGMPWHLLDKAIDTSGVYSTSPTLNRARQSNTGLAQPQTVTHNQPSNSNSNSNSNSTTDSDSDSNNPETPKQPPEFFNLDLAAAVHRQTVFIEQMSQVDWLHSPSLAYTIRTIQKRYLRFFTIMAHHPSEVAVPTHAVDLAWHTHQLDPHSYHTFSVATTGGIFIDHDDRIEEDTRNDAFGWTCEQYRLLSGGEDYTACLCWYCSACLEISSCRSSSSRSKVKRDHEGHVVPMSKRVEQEAKTMIAECQYEKLEEDYEYACVRTMGRGISSPNHKDFLDGYQWLYPLARPLVSSEG